MTTSFAIETVGFGILVPAAVSMAVVLLSRRCLPARIAVRYAPALGFSAGFLAGYSLLPNWAALVPSRHWHWLPYVGVLAAISPISLASGASRAERWLLQGLLGILAAMWLVPAWPSLQPPRSVCVCILAAYFTILAMATDGLPGLMPGRRVCAALCLAAAVTSGMVAALVSLTYGTLAGLAAASLGGVCLASWRKCDPVEVRGLIPVYSLVVGGCAFVGGIEPQPPQPGFLLFPAAPLALWICGFKPFRKSQPQAR